MNPLNGFHNLPGTQILSGKDDPDVRAENECREVGEVHYCAGGSLSLGFASAGEANDSGIGLVFVTNRGGLHGLSIALTSKAMRSLADALVMMSNDVDAHAAREARSAIDRARAAGQ